MNFKNILSLVFILALTGNVFGQACTLCVPDASVHTATGPEDVGIVPDNVSVFQAIDTSIVLQYQMPTMLTVPGIGTATVTSVTILGVNGLPLGLDWTSDQYPGNVYMPQTERYGCVTLCGETFAAPGVYNINVLVNGCGSVGGITQCQNENIPLVLTVLAPASGNALFSYNPGEACDSATVTFTANLTTPNPIINPVSYAWDFGDGDTASGSPVSHDYLSPDTYIVTHSTSIAELYVSQITFSAQGDWWYQEAVDDGLGVPGFFFENSPPDISGSVVSGGSGFGLPTIDNNHNPSWGGLDFVLTDQNLALTFQDEETFTNADQGGTGTVTITGPGLFTFNSIYQGAIRGTGTVTVEQQTQSIQIITDTVTIYSQSDTPTITNITGVDTLCAGDSIILECSQAMSYQWYLADTLLPNETSQTIVAFASGTYEVEVIDSMNICVSERDTIGLLFEDLDLPEIVAGAGVLFLDNPNEFDVQWYSNGVPIPNATMDSLSDLTSGGPFSVIVTSGLGCTSTSGLFEICLPGTSSSDSTAVSLSSSATFTAENFILKPNNDIAWAISSGAGVTDMTSLQTAIDAGLVFPSDSAGEITIDCDDIDLDNGTYYMTPLAAATFEIDSLIYNPAVDSGCIPDALICLEITGTDWLILAESLTFTFPDGQSVGILDALVPVDLQGVIPDTIQPSLLDLLPSFLPDGLCFQLFDLYQGDPNGTWTISAENVGTGSVTVTIPAFTSTVYADSCPLITMDQVIDVPATTGTIVGGSSSSLSFMLPPVPANFPTINGDCNAFGAATEFTVDCGTNINQIDVLNDLTLYPNPNNGQFNVAFNLTEQSEVEISILDVTGRLILDRSYNSQSGRFDEQFDLKNNMTSGFYVLNISINGQQTQQQFIVD